MHRYLHSACSYIYSAMSFAVYIRSISLIEQGVMALSYACCPGAVQSLGALLRNENRRCAAVTMLGKTAELCADKVSTSPHLPPAHIALAHCVHRTWTRTQSRETWVSQVGQAHALGAYSRAYATSSWALQSFVLPLPYVHHTMLHASASNGQDRKWVLR